MNLTEPIKNNTLIKQGNLTKRPSEKDKLE
jgi:hypothetical protein